jgi:transcriptional regulator NrdR family protein
MEPRKKKKKNNDLLLATRLEPTSENEMKLGLAYEKLKERVAKGIQADEMVTHILKELKVLDKVTSLNFLR